MQTFFVYSKFTLYNWHLNFHVLYAEQSHWLWNIVLFLYTLLLFYSLLLNTMCVLKIIGGAETTKANSMHSVYNVILFNFTIIIFTIIFGATVTWK